MKIEYRKLMTDVAGLARQIDPDRYDCLYAIPRGGVPVATALSCMLDIPIRDNHYTPNDRTLIIDDLIDSGRTLSLYQGIDTAVLYRKPHSPKTTFFVEEIADWIEFPYETTNSDIESNITRIIEYLGDNPNREGLIDTPTRVLRSWDRLYGGYKQKPEEVLKAVFNEQYDQMVVSRGIELYSTCEHHMIPFFGQCHIAYLPSGKVVGISKLSRLVEVFARRLQIQERLTEQIAHAINDTLKPKGVAVIIEAKHLCMMARGVEKQNSEMITSCMLGAFRDDPKAREEMMRLCLKSC